MSTEKQRTVHPSNDKWVVPKEILNHLGEFDLDVYAPFNRPWDVAPNNYTIIDDGLNQPWYGKVFCHPPDGKLTYSWLEKCARYGSCIALVYSKTDSAYFQSIIIKYASAALFFKGRVKFHYTDGSKADSAPLPSVLVAFDAKNAKVLESSGIEGSFIWLNKWQDLE